MRCFSIVVLLLSSQIYALDQSISEQEFNLTVAKAKVEMDAKIKPVQAEYDGKVKAAKTKLIALLEVEKTEVTKTGDLDKALALKAKIEELKAAETVAVPGAAKVQPADPAQALRDKAAPSVVGTWAVRTGETLGNGNLWRTAMHIPIMGGAENGL